MNETDSNAAINVVANARASGFQLVSSELLELELWRFIHRNVEVTNDSLTGKERSKQALAGIELIRLNSGVLKMAAKFPYHHLGSLDSIHLATAHMIGATHMLTNDKQLRQACDRLGIATTF